MPPPPLKFFARYTPGKLVVFVFRGSISLPDELLYIEPLHTFESFDASIDNEYVLYDVSDLEDATNGTCGHEHGDVDPISTLNEMKSGFQMFALLGSVSSAWQQMSVHACLCL